MKDLIAKKVEEYLLL